MRFTVKKADKEEQRVWGEVYIPNRIDTHGHMMLAEDVRKLAYSFMQRTSLMRTVDTQHDNWPNGSYPIESFIVDSPHPIFEEGSWVVGIQVTDSRVWQQVKSGELAGYSFEGTAVEQEAEVEAAVLRHQFGFTEPADDGHVHKFFAALDTDGRVIGGSTDTVDGHKHLIRKGTATNETNDHKHRFALH